MSLHADPLSVSGHSIDKIHLAAGTGTTPAVSIDGNGAGTILPGALSGTLSMNVDGVGGFASGGNLGVLNVEVDRNHRSFAIAGTLQLQSGNDVVPVVFDVSGVIDNEPPAAHAGTDAVVECNTSGGANVDLHGTFEDPEGIADIFRVAWFKDAPFDGTGGSLIAPWYDARASVPLNDSATFFFQVEDTHLQRSTDSVTVSVVDTTPPTIGDFSFTGPVCLWPPNHDYVVLRTGRDFAAMITDTCDPNPQLVVTGAESSQPDNALGDGNTTDDTMVFPDHVCVRAERQGTVLGRQYSIQLAAHDASGNRSDPTVLVEVGHDQGQDKHCSVELSNLETVRDGDPACSRTPSPRPTAAGQGPASCANSRTPTFFLAVMVLLAGRRRRR